MVRPRKAGFTLPELLLGVLLMSVIGSILLAVLLHQSRLYRHADDVMHAQRTLRAALDLASSELRMASSGDLMVAEAESVSVRADLWRAVVCDSTGPDQATLFVYDSLEGANLPAAFRGTAWAGPYDTVFTYVDGWSGVVSETGAAAESECTSRGAPSGWTDRSYRRVQGWSSANGAVPERGGRVRRYGRLSFSFRASSYGDATALWRNAQELVAPFEGDARFLYLLDDGSVTERVGPADLGRVRMIRMEVVALGEGRSPFGVRRPMSHDVWLRN